MEEKLYQVGLELIPGIGDVTVKNLIAYCGSASAIFKSKKGHLANIPGMGPRNIELLTSTRMLLEAEKIIESCAALGVNIIHYTDPTYPKKLKQVADAPNIIYTKGKVDHGPRVLAIVGTRNATQYGKEVTERMVEDSKVLNAAVVSGLAYGIDFTAHRAALKNQIPTIAVLAGGLDKIYPNLHRKTAEEMLETGGWISENPPGTKPDAHFFPARNRIIAGMSDAVIVVEAARKGGALITANIADSYHRPVFAVPGDLSNTFSEGCNYLIRNQQALIYTGVEDLIYHLNWDLEAGNTPAKKQADTTTLSDQERSIFEILEANQDGIAIDELSWKAQIPVNQVASCLLNMEFQGFVKSMPGKKYQPR